MTVTRPGIEVRQTRPADFGGIIDVGKEVYPTTPPWKEDQLASHLRVFPEGQFVAVEKESDRVVGMAASLIIWWDDYEMTTAWRDVTDLGMFTNHDPAHGRTLYGAEIMVRPSCQGQGIGTLIYAARRRLVEDLKLLRIRAGARLRGYHRHAGEMSAEEYVMKVVHGELQDPTLSFQLKHGFHVLAVVGDYLLHDPESLGHAAVIEWINAPVSKPEDYAGRPPRFQRRSPS